MRQVSSFIPLRMCALCAFGSVFMGETPVMTSTTYAGRQGSSLSAGHYML
jgi:hypothetical protein